MVGGREGIGERAGKLQTRLGINQGALELGLLLSLRAPIVYRDALYSVSLYKQILQNEHS